jgi:hypothetical protein
MGVPRRGALGRVILSVEIGAVPVLLVSVVAVHFGGHGRHRHSARQLLAKGGSRHSHGGYLKTEYSKAEPGDFGSAFVGGRRGA